MRGFRNSSFDPPTLVLLEAAFDEAWLTLKSIGNTTVKPDNLARRFARLANVRSSSFTDRDFDDAVRLALRGLIQKSAA
jgi:hypothetical protein